MNLILVTVLDAVTAVLLGVAAALLLYGLTCGLWAAVDFIQARKKMKQELRAKRDAMVNDLLNQVMSHQMDLQSEAMEARRNLIRVSFEINQATQENQDGAQYDEQYEDTDNL
jgi:hypothetical protein